MKIAVPSDDGKTIAGHTGRAQGFIIYMTESIGFQRLEYRRNEYTAHAQGLHPQNEDEHHHHHEHNHSHGPLLDALNGCKIVIAHGMGPRLVTDFEHRGISPVFTRETDADKAVSLYIAGKLETGVSSCCDRHSKPTTNL